MRKFVLGFALTGLVACADRLVAPNTDIGLRVWATVSPAMISIRDSTATVHLQVRVHNPSDRSIRVVSGGPPYRFTTDPANSRGLWGSIRIANRFSALNAGPNVDWWGDSVYVIAPHQVQLNEYAITLAEWRKRGWIPTPGALTVRSWFNGREGGSAALILVP